MNCPDCKNYEPKHPLFEVGDWVVVTGEYGHLGDIVPGTPLQVLSVNGLGDCKLSNAGQTWVQGRTISHATEDDWWFERNGDNIKAAYCSFSRTADTVTYYRRSLGDGVGVAYLDHGWLAKALDIPIQPCGWREER